MEEKTIIIESIIVDNGDCEDGEDDDEGEDGEDGDDDDDDDGEDGEDHAYDDHEGEVVADVEYREGGPR